MELASVWIGDSRSSHCFRLLFSNVPLSPFRFRNPKQSLIFFLKGVSFGSLLNLHTCSSFLVFFSNCRVRGSKILANVNFSSRASSSLRLTDVA